MQPDRNKLASHKNQHVSRDRNSSTRGNKREKESNILKFADFPKKRTADCLHLACVSRDVMGHYMVHEGNHTGRKIQLQTMWAVFFFLGPICHVLFKLHNCFQRFVLLGGERAESV